MTKWPSLEDPKHLAEPSKEVLSHFEPVNASVSQAEPGYSILLQAWDIWAIGPVLAEPNGPDSMAQVTKRLSGSWIFTNLKGYMSQVTEVEKIQEIIQTKGEVNHWAKRGALSKKEGTAA
jgi:hypothetical protein